MKLTTHIDIDNLPIPKPTHFVQGLARLILVLLLAFGFVWATVIYPITLVPIALAVLLYCACAKAEC